MPLKAVNVGGTWKLLAVGGELATDESCCCVAGCCVETRDVTLSGLVGILSHFNGTHTLERVGSPIYDGTACCYYLMLEMSEAEVLALEPCLGGPFPAQFELQLCVNTEGLRDFFLGTAWGYGFAWFRDAGWAADPTPVYEHDHLVCPGPVSVSEGDAWGFELVDAEIFGPCPCAYTVTAFSRTDQSQSYGQVNYDPVVYFGNTNNPPATNELGLGYSAPVGTFASIDGSFDTSATLRFWLDTPDPGIITANWIRIENTGYSTICIDGVEYAPGDILYLEPAMPTITWADPGTPEDNSGSGEGVVFVITCGECAPPPPPTPGELEGGVDPGGLEGGGAPELGLEG